MSRPILSTFAMLAALALATAATAQTTWYVDDDTCPDVGDGSIGNPFCHLQDALGVAVAGDTIEMAAGTYGPPPSGTNFLAAGQNVTIAGAGADQTIIDYNGVANADPIFVVLASATIRDLTIREGNKPSGSAGGIVTVIGTTLIERCRLAANVAGGGGGAAVVQSGTTTFRDCLFDGNDAQNGGGGGALVLPAGTAHFVNCTFSGNTATDPGGAVYAQSGATVTIENGIAWGNAPDELAEDDPGQITVTTAIIDGGWVGGTNVLDLDPQFVDAMTDDYRLDAGSPAIDAGDNGPATASTADLDGNPRFVDDSGVPDTGTGTPPIVDIGAYERQASSGPLTLHVPSEYATIQAAIDAASSGDTIEVAAGTYTEELDIPAGRELDIIAPAGSGVTTLRAIVPEGELGRPVTTDSSLTIEGLTITGGNEAGAILAPAEIDIKLRFCVVRDCENDLFGGTIDCLGSVTLENCLVHDCGSPVGSGGAIRSQVAVVLSSTIANNAAGGAGAIAVTGAAPAVVRNSIVWGNTGNSAFTGTVTAGGSIVQGGEGGGTDANPLFVDAAVGDFRLFEFSPAVDAGDNVLASEFAVDLDGLPRFVDDAGVADTGVGTPPIVDLGAYERQSESELATLLVPGQFPTIQGAIDAAASGVTIEIAPGVYVENLVVPSGTSLTIVGLDGADATIVDGDGVDRVLQADADLTVKGLTLTGGLADFGGGARVQGIGSTLTMVRCRVTGNTATTSGGGVYQFGLTNTIKLHDCLIDGNSASNGGGGVTAQAGDIVNCTIVNNDAPANGSAVGAIFPGPDLFNCIVWGNTGSSAFGATIPDVSSSIVQGGQGGGLDVDPLFADPGAGDYRLQRLSPAIDAGDNGAASGLAIDYDGAPRFVDDLEVPDTGAGTAPVIDLGAFELPFVDCDGDGVRDEDQISGDPALDCNGDDTLDACQAGEEGPCVLQSRTSGSFISCGPLGDLADQFVLSGTTVISKIRWWGSEPCSGAYGDLEAVFEVRFYSGGLSPTPGGTVAVRSGTASFVFVEDGGWSGVYRYELSAGTLTLAPGAYWIQISAEGCLGVAHYVICGWEWQHGSGGAASLPGSAARSYDDFFPTPLPWSSSSQDNYAFELICDLADCNDNLQIDNCELDADPGLDVNGDGLLDVCFPPCTGDTNGDGLVNVNDLNNVILDWGTDGSANGGDLTGPLPGDPPDGIVNVNDLNAVIVGWGLCP